MNTLQKLLLTCSLLFTVGLKQTAPLRAQPIPESNNVTATEVQSLEPNQFIIQGGRTSADGNNLFHGFQTFNLNAQQSATFVNSAEITNIFSRISGGTPSFIDGTIQVLRGQPNLYFLNPAGIIFGENAQLNVPGDFVASTATAIGFNGGWFNVFGTDNWQRLGGDPSHFAFNADTIGDIWVQGNLQNPVGDLGVIAGRIQGDRLMATPGSLLVTTAAAGQVIRLSQPGNLLSLELEISGTELGNPLNFLVTQLPQLLTGSGDIALHQIDAQYGIIAADNQLVLTQSQLQTAGHLGLFGRAITAQTTLGQSGLNQLWIGGELDGIYQTQKPFLQAIANQVNFAIQADPLDGTTIIISDDLLDTVATSTLNAGNITLKDSQFQAQNIYILGDNIQIEDTQLLTTNNINIFGLDTVTLTESENHHLALFANQDLSLRGNENLIIHASPTGETQLSSGRDLNLAAGNLDITETTLHSDSNLFLNADHLLIKNSSLSSGNDLILNSSGDLVLEDIADQLREPDYSSGQPLQLTAGGQLKLNSGDLLRVMAVKPDSQFQGTNGITITTQGDKIELLGNFRSDADITVGDRLTAELNVEGGIWYAGNTLTWLAKDQLLVQDFHLDLMNTYPYIDHHLSVTAQTLHLVADDLISIYLDADSLLTSSTDLNLTNQGRIYLTGNLLSPGNINILANQVEIGFNSAKLQLTTFPFPPNYEGRFSGGDIERDDPSLYVGGSLAAGKDITVMATDRLLLSDFNGKPLHLSAENINLSSNLVRLDGLNDPTSLLQATGNIFINSQIDEYFRQRIAMDAGSNIVVQMPLLLLQGADLKAVDSISLIANDSLIFDFPVAYYALKIPQTALPLPLTITAPTINLQAGRIIDVRLDNVRHGKIVAEHDLNLMSSERINLRGDIATAGNMSLSSADISLVRAKLTVGGDLLINAANRLQIEDVPLIDTKVDLLLDRLFPLPDSTMTTDLLNHLQLDISGNINLQGNQSVFIHLQYYPSSINSGKDINIISDGLILNNGRYFVGEDFNVLKTDGTPAIWTSNPPFGLDTGQFTSLYVAEPPDSSWGNFPMPLAVGQANLAQVYAGGNITFAGFEGRSLILEAGGNINVFSVSPAEVDLGLLGSTAELGSINLDVPTAFGYPIEYIWSDFTVVGDRRMNIPARLLSLTAGKNLDPSQQSIFLKEINVTGSLPFGVNNEAEIASIRNAIFIDNALVNDIPIKENFTIVNEDLFFTSLSLLYSWIPYGWFSAAIPVPNMLVLSDQGMGLDNSNVALMAIDNPVQSSVRDVTPVNLLDYDPSKDLSLTSLSKTLPGLDIETTSAKTLLQTAHCGEPFDEKLAHWRDCYQQQLQLAIAAQDLNQQSTALYHLGTGSYLEEDYDQALNYYQNRLNLATQMQDLTAQNQSLISLAQVYIALGKYQTAQGFNDRAIALVEAFPSPQSAQLQQLIFDNAGFIAYGNQAYDQAIANYTASLNIARSLGDVRAEINALTQLGLSYFQTTQYEQAKSLHTAALKLTTTSNHLPSQLRAHEGLAMTAYALGQYDQAILDFQQSLALAQTTGDRHAQARSWSGLGDAQYHAHQPEAAIQSLTTAIQLWEALRQNLDGADLYKVALLETQETTYSILQEVLLSQNQIGAALEITERGRSRALIDLLQRDLTPQAEPLPVQAPDLATLQRIASEQQATIVSYSLGRKVVDTAATRTVIETEIWIWVMQPDGTLTFRRQDLAALRQQGITLESLIKGSRCFGNALCLARTDTLTPKGDRQRITTSATIDPYLSQLHQLLIAPIADLLPLNPDQDVIFVPHRSLFMVPFAALQDHEGEYLIESHTIRMAPSIQVLDLTHQRRQTVTGTGVTIVSNPTMPDGLRPLPGTEIEAQAIARHVDSTLLTGDAATKANVLQQLPQSRVIHLATHGLLDGFGDRDLETSPGAIALAPTANDDGFLTAHDILNLDLNGEMVVLSACDTGRGTITEDGVIGLSRSFMGAGMPSVVVSLWKVPDISTADFMGEFYRQLQQNSHKAQALRQAMLFNMAKYPNPKDWAAFTLMGEN